MIAINETKSIRGVVRNPKETKEVAVGILKDLRATCTERFSGFTLTRFDGTTVTV